MDVVAGNTIENVTKILLYIYIIYIKITKNLLVGSRFSENQQNDFERTISTKPLLVQEALMPVLGAQPREALEDVLPFKVHLFGDCHH